MLRAYYQYEQHQRPNHVTAPFSYAIKFADLPLASQDHSWHQYCFDFSLHLI